MNVLDGCVGYTYTYHEGSQGCWASLANDMKKITLRSTNEVQEHVTRVPGRRLGGMTPPAGSSSSPSGAGDLIIKPQTDRYEYRFLKLPNELRVLLVHDAEADKAACAADVYCGSLLDPNEFLGLAHFLEHMLFYSSAKYPVEDEYSKFISDHGGHTNAYTAAENTNYQFDISWDHLEPALDRFAQFFIAPLISENGVEREVNAVDSEHGKNLQLDAWRQLQLAKQTANQEHPWARFATGNRDTLLNRPRAAGLDVRQAVVDFHEKHYSANIMCVAVLGRHSLDELQAMVEKAFGGVPNKNLPMPTFSPDVFLPQHRTQLLRVVPVREGHTVEWAWQTRPSIPLYRASPLNYLSHLLGHEGEGSVFALLKARRWASSLVAGESGSSLSCASFFYCRVELTEEGLKHVPEIGEIVFRYLALVRSGGICQDVYEEVAALQRLRFDFRDKQAPYSYTTALASAMHLYPDQDLLLALHHVPQEFNPELIAECAAEMVPDKVRMMWVSKTHAEVANETEPWYGAKYSLSPIPGEWMDRWKAAAGSAAGPTSELHLPTINPFIPTDLSLKREEAAAAAAKGLVTPVVVLHEPGLIRMWHKVELSFETPKADVFVDFQSPEAYNTPEAAVCTRLFVKLVADALNELAYPAELAGLSYAIHNTQAGFQVVLAGYNHKLPVLLDAVLAKVAGLQVLPDRFAFAVEDVTKEYMNMKYGQAYSWAMYRKELLLNAKRWRVEEYLEVIAGVTPKSLQAFISRMFSRVFVECMAVGNIEASEAVRMAQHLRSLLETTCGTKPVYPSQMRDLRAIKLPTGVVPLVEEPGPDPGNSNSAVSIAYQVGPDDLETNALLQLLVHLAKRDAFNVLRTQQQLGYVVSCFNNHELGIHQVEFLVQSTSHPTPVLAERIEGFVTQLVNSILPRKCGLPTSPEPGQKVEGGTGADGEAGAGTSIADDSEFRKGVSELVKAKLEKPKRLGQLAQRWWNEVFYGSLIFDRQEQEAAQLQRLEPGQLVEFARSVLFNRSTRRKAIVAVKGASEVLSDKAPAGPPPTLANGSAGAQSGATGGSAAGLPAVAPAADECPAAAASSTEASSSSTSSSSDGEVLLRVAVSDLSEFKRGLEVWPSVGGLYAQRRWKQAGASKL